MHCMADILAISTSHCSGFCTGPTKLAPASRLPIWLCHNHNKKYYISTCYACSDRCQRLYIVYVIATIAFPSAYLMLTIFLPTLIWDTSPTRQFAYFSDTSPGFFIYGCHKNSHPVILRAAVSWYP